MELQELAAIAGLIVLMGGVLGLFGKGAHFGWRTAQKVVRLVDDLAGEPPSPGNDGRPGLLQRVAKIEAAVVVMPTLVLRIGALEDRVAVLEQRTAAVEAQMQPNGGATLRDSLDRVEAALTPTVDPSDLSARSQP